MSAFDFKTIETKWQKFWQDNETFKTDLKDFSKPKYYVLDMFPYPSGVGLHAGHPEGYTATDIVSRYKRMKGYNVLHPMGFDSFGLPAEQYAIQTGNHPAGFTKKNIDHFLDQLKGLGFSYDWSKIISTSDPEYYKWTQWIFIKLFEDGYAKCVEMPVNWCEELGTVLANDEVIDGKSERGGYPVIRKNMKQWIMDIPAFAEDLLKGLDTIDWPESTKEMQRNWIGKSIGAEVNFKIDNTDYDFTVFTTRCDTLFGATYCVLSPEHPLIEKITTNEQKEKVEAYKKECATKSEMERTELNKDKTGVFTGAYAINPVNNKKIPIWISDYVLMSYGTGAIMAVPAHDERDHEFAKKFDLEIIEVLKSEVDVNNEAWTQDGLHVNSEFLDGLNKQDAIDKMLEFLENKGIGKKKINYKIREWIFARQRYWGEPIPVIHYEDGTIGVLDNADLPLVLPKLEDYGPSKTGAPLDKATEWVNLTYKNKKGKRETSTMPGSAGSSWYFLRYVDPHNDNEFANYDLLKHWLPVDLYIGGPEHAVGHLLYSRMWNNYLYQKGLVPVAEPFKKLVHQGYILGANGIKMGKRFPEYVVNPSDVVRDFGADTLRVYEMFMGPLEADKPWSTQGLEGVHKWLERVWRLIIESNKLTDENINNITTMSKDMQIYGSSYLILKAMMICDMKQNQISLEQAKAKTNQYIDAVYGAKGQSLKNVINSLKENDFTENQINLDTQKMSAYGQNMKEMMNNINELKGLEPLIRVTDTVLSNSNSRNAIATFYSNYKSESSKALIKGFGDGILSLNANDLKVITELKSNLMQVSKDIEANKTNIESINKMVEGLKGNPKLLKDIDKFSSDLKNSENTINEIQKVLSKTNGDVNVKGIKALTEKLLSMQQDLKDSEDILRITKGALQKDNVSRARELIKSLPELEKGIGDLAEGSEKLNNGMQKFHKEGIEKLNNEGQEAIQEVDDLVKIKDKLVELSDEYDTFTGKSSEMDGSVKFIMKTNEIKIQEKENNDEEVKEESKGFVNWIKNLVKGIFN